MFFKECEGEGLVPLGKCSVPDNVCKDDSGKSSDSLAQSQRIRIESKELKSYFLRKLAS